MKYDISKWTIGDLLAFEDATLTLTERFDLIQKIVTDESHPLKRQGATNVPKILAEVEAAITELHQGGEALGT